MHPTTIAKIEAGDRSVTIDEAAGVADLLELSLDSLLGRLSGLKTDLAFALRALQSVAHDSVWELTTMQVVLGERLADLSDFEFDGREELDSEAARAMEALGEAHRALDNMSTFEPPPGAAIRPRDELRRKAAVADALAALVESGGLADEEGREADDEAKS